MVGRLREVLLYIPVLPGDWGDQASVRRGPDIPHSHNILTLRKPVIALSQESENVLYGMRMRMRMRKRKQGGWRSLLLLILLQTSNSLANSMSFAFAPVSTESDSFATFAFAPIEAPHYVYMFYHFCRICMPCTRNLSLKLHSPMTFESLHYFEINISDYKTLFINLA